MKAFPDSFRNAVLSGTHNLVSDTVVAVAIDLGVFTPTLAMDFFNDVTTGVISSVTVTGKTVGTGGVGLWTHADAIFPLVTGNSFEQILYYKSTGVSSTSPLIVWNDQFTPVVPNGENVGLLVPSGVFQLLQAP